MWRRSGSHCTPGLGADKPYVGSASRGCMRNSRGAEASQESGGRELHCVGVFLPEADHVRQPRLHCYCNPSQLSPGTGSRGGRQEGGGAVGERFWRKMWKIKTESGIEGGGSSVTRPAMGFTAVRQTDHCKKSTQGQEVFKF